MSEQLLYSVTEFLSRTPSRVPCIVDRYCPKSGLVAVVAKSGAAKTFMVLDLVCHVVLGWDWNGYAVDRTSVLYVAGEGASGLASRVSSWCDFHQVEPNALDEMLIMPRPLDLSDDELVRHVEHELGAREAAPGLIVLDTLSSNAPAGFSENDTAHMKGYLDLARRLRDRWECTVMIVHHTGHAGERARGASDFYAALDAEIFIDNREGMRTVKLTKSRDFDPPPPLHFRLRSSGSSAVVVYHEGEGHDAPLLPSARQALRVLAESDGPLKVTEWQRRCEGRVKSSQFYEIRRSLERLGLILVEERRGAVLTQRGKDAMGSFDNPVVHSDRSPTGVRPEVPDYSTPVTPLKGGITGVVGPALHWSATGVTGANGRAGKGASRESGHGLDPHPWDDYFQASTGSAT